MTQDRQDLLICVMGSERIATQLADRFRARFPRIHVYIECMMGALVAMSQHRFRAVVVATTTDAKNPGRIMVRKLRELGYSPNDIFLYCGDSTVCDKDQTVVDAYAKGNEEGLLAAARKAAQRDPYCRWPTQEELDVAQAAVDRFQTSFAERQRIHPPPPPKRWYMRIIDRIWKR